MATNTNTQPDRTAYLRYFDDGLWDILLGLPWLLAGILMISNTFDVVFPVLPIVLVVLSSLLGPVMWILKRRLIAPRLNLPAPPSAEVATARRPLTTIILALVVGLGAGIVVFVLVGAIVLAVLIALLVIMAGVTRVWRLYAYAAVIFGLFFAGDMLNIDLAYGVLGAGAVFFTWGLVLLVVFLRKHPPSMPTALAT
jgi:hypothetical protein